MKYILFGLLAAANLVVLTVAAESRAIKGLFNDSGKGLTFLTDDWSIRSEDGRGWASLKVKGAEFLSAVVFQKDGKFVTEFPDHSNLSHDRMVGRIGSVSNGIHLLKITPNAAATAFQLYAGYNDGDAQKLIVFLDRDVTLERGDERTVLKHKAGSSLVCTSPCWSGPLKDPSGTERPALVFDTKGFAANAFEFTVPSARPLPAFGGDAAFCVRSSDDPAANVLGPTRGVKNPIYGKETKLDFAVELLRLKPEPFTGYVEIEVVHSLGGRDYYERQDLKAVRPDEKGRIAVPFHPKFTRPGASEVWGRVVDADGNLLWVDRFRMAYDWEHYRPTIQVEPDFTQFWERTLTELRAMPLHPVTERVKEFADHPEYEIYDVTISGWDKQRLHAMLFVPKGRTRPLPAIVTAHPGTTGFGVNKRPDGTYGSKLKQDPRFVTIVPLIRGHAPDAQGHPVQSSVVGSARSPRHLRGPRVVLCDGPGRRLSGRAAGPGRHAARRGPRRQPRRRVGAGHRRTRSARGRVLRRLSGQLPAAGDHGALRELRADQRTSAFGADAARSRADAELLQPGQLLPADPLPGLRRQQHRRL